MYHIIMLSQCVQLKNKAVKIRVTQWKWKSHIILLNLILLLAIKFYDHAM